MAGIYAFQGDRENEYRILKQFKESDWYLGNPYLVPIDPLFDKIRNDKEFKELLQKVFDEKARLREKIRKLEEEGKL